MRVEEEKEKLTWLHSFNESCDISFTKMKDYELNHWDIIPDRGLGAFSPLYPE
jgi:hypothetical protein